MAITTIWCQILNNYKMSGDSNQDVKLLLIIVSNSFYSALYLLGILVLTLYLKIKLDIYQVLIIVIYSVGFICKIFVLNLN